MAPEDIRFTHRLAWCLAALALLGVLPALGDLVEHFRSTRSTGVARWALCILLVALVQFSYLVYLFQLPDYSSLRMVALSLLVAAMSYAQLLGISLLVGGDNELARYFELGDALRGGLVRLWALVMTSGSSAAALFAGRAAARIRRRLFPPQPGEGADGGGTRGDGVSASGTG